MSRVLPVTACALLVAACGSPAAGPADTGGAAGGSGASSSFSPITVTRSGGVAGFHDRITVGPDGTAIVTTRRGPETRCEVDRPLLRSIAAGAARVDWSSLPAPQTSAAHPDDLVVVVGASGHAARIDNPVVQPLRQPLTDLLNDATAPPARRTHCRPR
jgi:hypothetical protein